MRRLIFTALFLCAAFTARPQDESQTGTLIRLNVVATDSHNQPITDLNQDDFEISENGKPRKIAYFHKNESKPENAGPPLAAHEFSNRAGVALPRVTLILFDFLEPRLGEQGRAREQIIKALQPLESGDDVYLYILTREGLFPVRGLPEGEVTPSAGGASWTSHIQEMLTEAMRRVTWTPPPMDLGYRIQDTYNVLAGLAWRLESIPGRKNIVWITHGVPISIAPRRTADRTGVDLSMLMARLGTILDRAEVAVYPVDLGAPIDRSAVSSAQDSGNARATSRGGARGPANNDDSAGLAGTGTAEEIADLTGGRAYLNANAGGAITQAIEDARFSYSIGYYESGQEADGKFHKLRVNCSRHGVHIQAKKGYYAYPASDAGENSIFEAAAASPFDASEIGVRVRVSPGEKVAHSVHFHIRIEANDVFLIRKGDTSEGSLAMQFAIYDENGRPASTAPLGFQFHLSREQRDTAIKNGMILDRDVPAPDAAQKIRCIVYDRNSRSIGSVTIPITPADRGPAQ